MNNFHHGWGRPRNDVYGAYNPAYLPSSNGAPQQHTQHPIVVGSSVIGTKFKNGVIIAADTLASYGSLLKYQNVQRVFEFNKNVVIGFSGDMSDMQAIQRMLQEIKTREEFLPEEERSPLTADNVHHWLCKLMYKHRSNLDPFWNNIIVGGFDAKKEPFLASVDLLAVSYEAPCLASGFGAHIAVPMMRKRTQIHKGVPDITKTEATEMIQECMKVLYYRDTRSLDQYYYAVVEDDNGTTKAETVHVEKCDNQLWKYAEQVRGYGGAQVL